ncbi:YcaO-like family protein, partial [Limosilactobacillus reuteri]|uniref:YcaO-like family protein n=1 Tax=Limosilactobacillus reuteri TaxID=1598 RepID=UPI000F41004C
EIPGHKIKLSQCNISKELAYAVNRLKRQGYQIDLFEISVISPVYVVWCLIRNNHSNAKMFSYSAAGSGLVLSDAVSAALKEAVVGMSIYANEQEEMPKVPKNIVTLEDHVRFYGNIANKNAFNFTNQFTNFVDDNRYLNLGSQNTSITKSEVINFIIEKLKKEFKDILIVNLTSDYLKKHDLYTVKAVIPGMFPMTFGDNSL